jgi:ubiquinone/menaquinone biosynthesis C-methylase UbiE
VSGSGFEPPLVRAAYEAVAGTYAATFGDDLVRLDLDRRLLDRVAEHSAGRGHVLDVGCGPAHVAEYLADRHVDVVGIDFAPAMLTVARQRAPSLAVVVADLRALPIRSDSVAGVTAFYVLQHLPRAELQPALRELRRVLVRRGVVLVVVHAGEGEFRPARDVTATRYTAEELVSHLSAASLVADAVHHREPLRHEHQGERCYVLAHAL